MHHENLQIVLCGHMHRTPSGEWHREDTNMPGKTVHQILANYQHRTPEHGNGLLRIMTFTPSQNKVDVQTYSPHTLAYETDADSQFWFNTNWPASPPTQSLSFHTGPSVYYSGENEMKINFWTEELTRYKIDYGPTTSYGTIVSVASYTQNHEAVLTNLNPGTTYYYRVRIYDMSGDWGEENGWFVTADDSDTQFDFVVIGDNRPENYGDPQPTVFSTLVTNSFSRSPQFYLSTGDIVQLYNIGTVDYEEAKSAWKGYTDVTKSYISQVPFYHSIGNHEKPDHSAALQRWRDIFSYPDNGDGSTHSSCYQNNCYSETTYSFDYGNSLFVALNSEEPGQVAYITGAQLTWLENVLSSSSHINKFVFLHRPIMGSTRTTYPNADYLDQVFSDNGVTAVFQGHDHMWCDYTSPRGVTYIITGGGGAPLYTGLCVVQPNEISEYHYSLVQVSGSSVTVTAYDQNDNQLKSLTL